MTDNNQLAIANGNKLGIFSSFKADTQEERLALYNAVQDAEQLEDHVNEVLNLRDVIIQPVEIEDEVTGELVCRKRIVVIDDAGKPYACMSVGVETAINNLIATVGAPTWEPALPLTVVKKPSRNGYKFTTLVYNPA